MFDEFVPVATPDLGPLERSYLLEAFDSGWVSSLGPFIDRFERGLATWVGVDHAVAVSSGTTALEIALRAIGIGEGDEVVVPSFTFAAVPASVVHTGATPVFADVDADNWCMDPDALERSITSETAAVVAVHSYGMPADLARISEVCEGYGLRLVEDCAEAHGASFDGRFVGSFGDVGCFSFYGNKILTSGEGGAVVTDDPRIADRVRYLKDHAMDPGRRYFHSEAGFNYRITNLQAAVGCAQLDRSAQMLGRRREILVRYHDAFADLPLVVKPSVREPQAVNWLTSIVLSAEVGVSAAAFGDLLRSRGIDSRTVFAPLPAMPPYQHLLRTPKKSGPRIAEALHATALSLPTSSVFDDAVVDRVVNEVRAILESLAR